MKRPKLFALLVAIDKYQPPVTPLQGCINDLEKVCSYLDNLTYRLDPEIRILRNSQATKDAVVSGFKNHLGAAKENDVVFFYFSGHGTQEEADPIFWSSEPDRKLEALVCYDSCLKENGNIRYRLLADKELRYLINQVSQNGPHILGVFDCCHSGGNTRNGYVSQHQFVNTRRLVNKERLSRAFPARAWEDFIFSQEITKERAQNQSISQWLPEGKHIQMAACQDDQSAFEVNGEGVFTKNLIDILTRCQGKITYFDLQSRIQNYIKNQFDQKPKIYTSQQNEQGLFLGFLNGLWESKPNYGNVNFNQSLGWIMDLGAMQGVPPQSVGVQIESLDGKHQFQATLGSVYPNHSNLIFEQSVLTQIDESTDYIGYLENYMSYPIGVWFDPELKKKISIDTILRGQDNMNIASERHQAQYYLELNSQNTIISGTEMPGVPLVPVIANSSQDDLSTISNYLAHIAQFEFVKNLHNVNTFLFSKEPVELTIHRPSDEGEEQDITGQNDIVSLNYQLNNQGASEGIKIKLRNRSDNKLYVALLYLSMNFGVSTKLLPEIVHHLEPNQEVWAFNRQSIPLKMEPEIKKFNYPFSTSYLKLMICTEDFKDQVTRFELPDLPSPAVAWRGTKGLAVNSYNPGAIQDWTTRLYTIKIANPGYQEVR